MEPTTEQTGTEGTGRMAEGKGSAVATVQIDTSLQIERLKESKKARPVEDAIKPFRFRATSTYARFEFKIAWLRDLGFLHEVARKSNRPEDLFSEIDRRIASHPANRRRLQRMVQGIVSFLGRVPGKLPYDLVVIRLREHLAQAVLGSFTWWKRSVTHEFDGTGCARAQEAPKLGEDGRLDVYIPKCKRSHVSCRIAAFLKQHEEAFKKIASRIEAKGDGVSKELREAPPVIRTAIKNPDTLCDSNYCRKIGDVLIAIDGMTMSHFAANNDNEWELLADALSKKLLNPVRRKTETAGNPQ